MKWWVRLLSGLAALLPRKTLRALGRPLGYLWFDILRVRRNVVLNNLSQAFPDWSQDKKIKVGRKSVLMIMENFMEFFLIPRIDQAWVDQHVVFHGEEFIQKAFLEKKGVLTLGVHLGHGDFQANLIQFRGYPITIITKFFKAPWMNHLWFAIRGAKGVKYIEPHGEKTPFAILKTLKSNAMVTFVLDQHMGKPYGVRTTFFGIPAGTAYGLALFYLKTQAPVIFTYAYEGEDNKIHVVFERVLGLEKFLLSPPEEREQTLVRVTQLFTDKIEEVVRKYPEQWMWVHRRWKWKGP